MAAIFDTLEKDYKRELGEKRLKIGIKEVSVEKLNSLSIEANLLNPMVIIEVEEEKGDGFYERPESSLECVKC